jgi:hypothetical protein
LYGQVLTLLSERSSRGKEQVIVELADGRRRSIPKSAIDLKPVSDKLITNSEGLMPVSVRTLLPLAQWVRAMLVLQEEVQHVNTKSEQSNNTTLVNNRPEENSTTTQNLDTIITNKSTTTFPTGCTLNSTSTQSTAKK